MRGCSSPPRDCPSPVDSPAWQKDPGFGVSQFMEGARYQHALETELARTISSLQQVERGPRAPGVAPATPPSCATALPERQRVRAAAAGPDAGARAGHRDREPRRLQHSGARRGPGHRRRPAGPPAVGAAGSRRTSRCATSSWSSRARWRMRMTSASRRCSSPLVGAGRVRAQVSAQFDLSASEEAREQFRPESQIVRSEQLSEETSARRRGAGGVPGALTNQPPAAGVRTPRPARAQAGRPPDCRGRDRGDDAGQFSGSRRAISRSTARWPTPASRPGAASASRSPCWSTTCASSARTARSPSRPGAGADRAHHALVKDAVGFDEARGDSVNVVNSPWKGEPVPSADDLVALPVWERPWARDLAKILAGLIVALVLVFAVLRPLLRQLTATPRVRLCRPAGSGGAGRARLRWPARRRRGQPGWRRGPVPTRLPAAAVPSRSSSRSRRPATVVAQDPARVAQVVKTWVSADG